MPEADGKIVADKICLQKRSLSGENYFSASLIQYLAEGLALAGEMLGGRVEAAPGGECFCDGLAA